MDSGGTIRFSFGGIIFEYDEEKNRKNIEKHGISFKTAARVFFDYDRIEMFDDEHSIDEDRYNTIGNTSVGGVTVIGTLKKNHSLMIFCLWFTRSGKPPPRMANPLK